MSDDREQHQLDYFGDHFGVHRDSVDVSIDINESFDHPITGICAQGAPEFIKVCQRLRKQPAGFDLKPQQTTTLICSKRAAPLPPQAGLLHAGLGRLGFTNIANVGLS